MKRILSIALLLVWVSVGYANEEITVELPGGGTMEFVWIEPGTFTMGTTEEQEQLLRDKGMWIGEAFDREQPAHEVTISRGFWLGKYELTQGQWQAVMGTTPWSGQENYVWEKPNVPAVYISWDDVQSFIEKLNEAAGEEIFRLPTEAEWEYACRAGTTTLWCFGDDEGQLGEYAWYYDNAGAGGRNYGQKVGTKLPNPWGLYDMHGNVYEWVLDWYEVGSYSSEAQVDPQGPAPSALGRVARGSAFFREAQYVRSAGLRGYSNPKRVVAHIGAHLLRMGPKITTITPESWGQIKDDSR